MVFGIAGHFSVRPGTIGILVCRRFFPGAMILRTTGGKPGILAGTFPALYSWQADRAGFSGGSRV